MRCESVQGLAVVGGMPRYIQQLDLIEMDQFDVEAVSADCSATMIGRPDRFVGYYAQGLTRHTEP
jgi:hypothetical protein